MASIPSATVSADKSVPDWLAGVFEESELQATKAKKLTQTTPAMIAFATILFPLHLELRNEINILSAPLR